MEKMEEVEEEEDEKEGEEEGGGYMGGYVPLGEAPDEFLGSDEEEEDGVEEKKKEGKEKEEKNDGNTLDDFAVFDADFPQSASRDVGRKLEKGDQRTKESLLRFDLNYQQETSLKDQNNALENITLAKGKKKASNIHTTYPSQSLTRYTDSACEIKDLMSDFDFNPEGQPEWLKNMSNNDLLEGIGQIMDE